MIFDALKKNKHLHSLDISFPLSFFVKFLKTSFKNYFWKGNNGIGEQEYEDFQKKKQQRIDAEFSGIFFCSLL